LDNESKKSSIYLINKSTTTVSHQQLQIVISQSTSDTELQIGNTELQIRANKITMPKDYIYDSSQTSREASFDYGGRYIHSLRKKEEFSSNYSSINQSKILSFYSKQGGGYK
jgi:hypothetical protein